MAKAKTAEKNRKAKETEKARKAGETEKGQKLEAAEAARKAKEAEKGQKLEAAGAAREAKEAEKAQKLEAAEAARKAKEAEKAQKLEAAAAVRRAKEAEKGQKLEAAEAARKAKEAEKGQKLEAAEAARKAKEAEKAQKLEAAEAVRKAKEAEKGQKLEAAEAARKAKEAEKAQKAEAAEAVRRAKEAEKAQKLEAAAAARKAKEAEKAQKLEAAEAARKAKEAEKAQKLEAAAAAREAKEAEKAQKAEAAEAVRRAKEAEKAQKLEAAEAARKAKEAEKGQKLEAAEAARKAKEAEKGQKLEAAEAARKAKEAEKAQKLDAAEAARKAKEAEKAQKFEAAEEPRPTLDKPHYYLTTAIAYPNGAPHVGFAYELIATDAIARFKRLDGYDVYFLTGTDEHGIKMLQTAAKEHITPQQLTERTVPRFQALAERMNCSNDDFIRTTEERHHRSSEAIWQRMEANGDIYLDKYSGWYSVRDEAYYDEDETRLDEKGVRLGPQNTPVEWVEEESYFFRLSAYQQKLVDLYEKQPDFVLPKERMNEVASFVRRGLKDLSISRTTFDWGIPVPGTDPQGRPRTTNAKHVMYVWVDALTNYITAVGFPDTNAPKFRRYWPADLHVIGKDITRFHAVYWPAFLMSAGIELPKQIFSHGFLFNRGEKISKSVGNVLDPFALADAYGVDQLRYFLLREVPFGQDGNYSLEAIANRINADLANDLGNLAQRSLTMIGRQLGGVLPKPGAFSEADKAMLAATDALLDKAREAMKTQQLHQVLNAVWAVVAEANRYFAGEAPWALAKTDPPRQRTVLYVTAEVVRQVAILAQPAMPDC